MDWRSLAFAAVLAAELFLLAALVVSIGRPRRRIWPPPGQGTWQFWSVWMATAVAFVGVRYRSLLLSDRGINRMATIAVTICLVLASCAALLGVFVNKVAPLE